MDVGEVPFAGAFHVGIDEEAEDFLPPVLVDVADGHRPRAVGRNGREAARLVRVERGKIPISHRPERLAGERKGPQKARLDASEGIVHEEIDLTVSSQVADANVPAGALADELVGQRNFFVE